MLTKRNGEHILVKLETVNCDGQLNVSEIMCAVDASVSLRSERVHDSEANLLGDRLDEWAVIIDGKN